MTSPCRLILIVSVGGSNKGHNLIELNKDEEALAAFDKTL